MQQFAPPPMGGCVWDGSLGAWRNDKEKAVFTPLWGPEGVESFQVSFDTGLRMTGLGDGFGKAFVLMTFLVWPIFVLGVVVKYGWKIWHGMSRKIETKLVVAEDLTLQQPIPAQKPVSATIIPFPTR